MHQDLEALEICCKHYHTTYADENLRKVKNRNRCLERKIGRQQIEIHFLRHNLRRWMLAHSELEERYHCFLKQLRSVIQKMAKICKAYLNG